MCRRWTGSAFATLIWFDEAAVTWTGKAPKEYRSSPIAVRSHCETCGTPIHLAYLGRNDIALTAGTAANAVELIPTHHYGAESKLPWADLGAALPRSATRERW
jgi:hypothetical protein